MRFLLFVLIIGGIALYFTNPSTDDIRAKLNGQIPAQLSGTPAMPATPPAPDQPAPPSAPATADQPAMPSLPSAPASADQPGMPSVPPAVTDAVQGEMQFERKDYYLFSIYKITVGGQQLPGCIIGVAKQAIPNGQC